MEYFNWGSEMSTGIELIDAQHQEVAMHINRVFQAAWQKRRDEEGAALSELLECIESHFCLEEELLEAAAYDDLKSHKQEHNELRNRLRRNFSLFLEGNDISLAMIADLRMWLTTHIRNDDAQYAPHLLQQLVPSGRRRSM